MKYEQVVAIAEAWAGQHQTDQELGYTATETPLRDYIIDAITEALGAAGISVEKPVTPLGGANPDPS